MSIPPEVLFHRYFQELRPEDRQNYKGKYDLDKLEPPEFQSLLVAIQEALNETLNYEQPIPEHVAHPSFHFDYVDCPFPDAIAFRWKDYSFIGITVELIYQLWETCVQMSEAQALASCLDVSLAADERDALRVVLFRIQLFFVVTHEYTHHVHGHIKTISGASTFSNENLNGSKTGNLERQAREIDADAYAIYHVLTNLIDGPARPSAIDFLKLHAEPASIQDEILFSCFVVAVGAFFFLRFPVAIDKASIYTLTHPPQAARMNCVMQQAIRWCKQRRPGLEASMPFNRFEMLMNTMAEATLKLNRGHDWTAQTEFLRSQDGIEYFLQLDKLFKTHVQSL